MATERLYYDDPFLLTFEAHVADRRQLEGRPALVLDRTAFYPTSGGQPHDLGTLNGVSVVDVREEDGEIIHLLDGEVPAQTVRGQVHAPRRFDHMQQHTGQHILSQAFVELLGAQTVSFHLGVESCTIDLDRTGLSKQDLARVEDRANAVVFEDRPVVARFVSPQELAQTPVRKPPTGHEHVRIVEVQGYDWSPCGGTHCPRTGHVGTIRITHAERRGQETRVTFLCGWRALRDAQWKHDLLTELGSFFSVGLPDLPATVARLAEREAEARREVERGRQQLLRYEAKDLYERGEVIGPARVVQVVYDDRSLGELRALGRQIAALPGGVALLGLRGESARLCFVRAEELPWDMGTLVREAAAVLGGRGGGRPHEAQGGGPEVGRLDEAIMRALEEIRAQAH